MLSDNRSKFIRLFGFITLGILFIISAYTYLEFAFSESVNILYPFIAVVFLGSIFLLIYSAIGLFASMGSNNRTTAFYVEIIIAIMAIVETVDAILSVPALNYSVLLTPFNPFVASSCVLGIILGAIGLIFFAISVLDSK